MPRIETRSSQFGLVSGIRQPISDLITVAEPGALFAPEARKGRLYIVAETDQEALRGSDACLLVERTIRKVFYDDRSYSVTSALRKAISAANKALYQQNFHAVPQKRAVVGLTCAVIKEKDLYLAQVMPSQAYLFTEGKLRALPTALSWNATQTSVAPFVKPGSIGASLSIEPEFYRAVLRPGDTILLCSSNLGRMLGRDEVLRMLQANEPGDVVDMLLAICKQNAIPEAHGLAINIFSPLSPAARAAPLSRNGIGERSRLLVQSAGDRVARLTGEIVLLARGPGAREQRRKAASQRERERREAERLTQPPEEPAYTPAPAYVPPPLDVGESLEERIAREREEHNLRQVRLPRPSDGGLPPSAFLGEGGYYTPPPPAERRIDLSDTPGMAAIGNHARRVTGQELPVDATLGERIMQPLDRLGSTIAGAWRRRRMQRPPPSAMRHNLRRTGLSYRRQAPPFPWRLLTMLVLLVTLLVVYGYSLARENTIEEAYDTFEQAELVLGQLRNAPDTESARELLNQAAIALADVRASGVITSSQESSQRYEVLQREYDRILAAVDKITYFDDLTELGRHPQASAASTFASIVVPPPPDAITNTAGFNWIYLLDNTAGAIYRMPKTGGELQPFLRPTDRIAAELPVGKVKAQAWRIDNIVAVAQSTDGPFIYYFRSGDSWRYSNLGGSEEWGTLDTFSLKTYEGNLYVWGAAPGQVLKYVSGRPGDLYDPWIKNDRGSNPSSGIDIAVDGNIYVLQPDGAVLEFEFNEFKRRIPPPQVNPPLVTPTAFVVTGPPGSGHIYLLDTLNERIIKLDKATGAFIQQIRARPDGPVRLDQLAAIAVDEEAPQPLIYLVNGGQILRATMPNPPRPFGSQATPAPTSAPQPTPATQAP